MERFFLEHHVQRDRDPDELARGKVNSDSEASDEEEITDRVHSVMDPTGPWAQKPVSSGGWGQPKRGIGGARGRHFASAHTGPKGVISDYKAHKRYQKQERARKEAERQAVLSRIAKGATVSSASANTSAAELMALQDACACDGGSDCECEQDELADDAFLAQYTQKRMQQMQAAAQHRAVFGELEYLSPDRFVQLTSATAANAASKHHMLVHLYHPENYACSLLNQQLEVLARQLEHVKFAALVAKDADASIEMADLPVVLLFRGQQQEAVVDVAQQLDGEFTLARVTQFVRTQLGL